ncbi:MAG: CoA transferase, partial [Leptospiraceae bacterium]|nr:CoA transferase [Leptospiraceae bacterium]
MKLPLEGITVIDLTMLLPGPLCSMYLGDMGANIIKIENPRAADGSRYMTESKDSLPGLYLMLNRNKKSITLNLKRKESREIFFKLLEKADILLEGFRPGALEEMGYGYETLKEKFPRLIYCGISGYGEEGKLRDHAGHDGNYLALSGVLEQIGSVESPAMSGAQFADIGGGSLTALSSILLALYEREKTGRGQKIIISMMESSLQFLTLYAGLYLTTGSLPQRGSEILSGKLPNYNIYKIQGGRFVFLGALEERFFRAFLRQIKKEDLLEDIPLTEEHYQRWKEILIHFFAGQSLESLKPLFENTECCLTPIRNLEEVFNDEEFQQKNLVFEMKHPKYGQIKQ